MPRADFRKDYFPNETNSDGAKIDAHHLGNNKAAS